MAFSTPNNMQYDYFINDNATLVCDIQYYVEFQWQFSDKSVVPSNNGKYQYIGTNLLIKNLSLSDSASYLCVGNNQITTVSKLKVNLEVFSKSVIIIILFAKLIETGNLL